jgi:hypothetical protein
VWHRIANDCFLSDGVVAHRVAVVDVTMFCSTRHACYVYVLDKAAVWMFGMRQLRLTHTYVGCRTISLINYSMRALVFRQQPGSACCACEGQTHDVITTLLSQRGSMHSTLHCGMGDAAVCGNPTPLFIAVAF